MKYMSYTSTLTIIFCQSRCYILQMVDNTFLGVCHIFHYVTGLNPAHVLCHMAYTLAPIFPVPLHAIECVL